jgi:hypothetical protein
MPFTAEEIANINAASLEAYIEKGTVFKQNVSMKPMLKEFDDARGQFAGGNTYASVGVKSGQGGGSLAGYTHDDQVSYYNSATNKRVKYAWKEHHIGQVITHTELKIDGVDVSDEGSKQSTSDMDGREEHVLANLLDEKNDDLGEDYAKSLDSLIHGDGTSDTKALAGIRSLIVDDPTVGVTGGLDKSVNTGWRNRAFTGVGGAGAKFTSSTSGGGALLQALQKEFRTLGRYAQGGTRWRYFAGTDLIDAIEKELRANGNYTLDGFTNEKVVDGSMADVKWKGQKITWDPTMDDLGYGKRLYVIDMRRIRLLYMNGQRMKKHQPARPYDRYVMYNGLTTTAVMVAQQLNTSAVYDIN